MNAQDYADKANRCLKAAYRNLIISNIAFVLAVVFLGLGIFILIDGGSPLVLACALIMATSGFSIRLSAHMNALAADTWERLAKRVSR